MAAMIKNSTIGILILLLASVLASCKQSFEDKVRDELEKFMVENAKYPGSVSVSDIKTVYCKDSICIMQFTLRGHNSFGKMISQKMEYVYMNAWRGKLEHIRRLDDSEPFLDFVENARKKRYGDNLYPATFENDLAEIIVYLCVFKKNGLITGPNGRKY